GSWIDTGSKKDPARFQSRDDRGLGQVGCPDDSRWVTEPGAAAAWVMHVATANRHQPLARIQRLGPPGPARRIAATCVRRSVPDLDARDGADRLRISIRPPTSGAPRVGFQPRVVDGEERSVAADV